MNKENLKKAIDYLEADYDDINERFNMRYYRNDEFDEDFPICNSVGCLVGHLTAIDADNVNDNFKVQNARIRFEDWSYNFFGVSCGNPDWNFMFGNKWAHTPESSTLRQGINRMKYMLEHERHPKDWKWGDTYE